MSEQAAGHLLLIDDDQANEGPAIGSQLAPYDVQVRFRHPESVLATDLEWANVVVVDYFLTSWSERDELDSVARAPKDGLAVISVLRSQLLPSLGDRRPGFSVKPVG